MTWEDLANWFSFFYDYFIQHGMVNATAKALATLLNLLIIIIVVIILDQIARRIIIVVFHRFSQRSRTTFDDFLAESNFPRFIAHFIPVMLLRFLEPLLFQYFSGLSGLFIRLTDIYIVILSVLVFRSVMRSVVKWLNTKERYMDKPLESYMQVFMIFAWVVGGILIVNILTGYSVTSLTAMGAGTAGFLLIFRDSILGFVASIQVSVNDIVRIGDWITFSKYGADGTVMEITLSTVKVQNFDKTFTTIPTYALISDSFQNWRGMEESQGRRIKRAVYIKQNSVRFIDQKDIDRLKQISQMAPYLDHRQRDIDKFNQDNEIDKSLLINGRNQTNLGVFRKYLANFISQHPAINKEMTSMVRQLAPTPQGIPLEIYCFSGDQRWEQYEYIQADIFDHVIAAVPYFELELFEVPSGKDLGLLNPSPGVDS